MKHCTVRRKQLGAAIRRFLLIYLLWGSVGLANALLTSAAELGIVINEIMYHPPAGQTNLQYVELFNAGTSAVDMSAWAFQKGVQYTFPNHTSLKGGDYLVICRDTNAFFAHYGRQIPALGNFTGKLSRKAERLELANAQGQLIDAVRYSDRDGWPAAADGESSSLERITPGAGSDRPENWAASNWPTKKKASGTPGTKNDSFCSNFPPVISHVERSPQVPTPQQKLKISASIRDSDGIASAALLYRLAGPGRESDEIAVGMTRTSGNEKDGVYEGTLDGQAHGQLIRYRIRATDSTGAARLAPAPNDPRPTYSCIVLTNTPKATVAIGYVINIGRIEQGPPHNTITPKRSPPTLRGRGAFVYVPHDGGVPELYDYVHVATRSGGYKVRFQKDQRLKGMSSVNLIAEGPLRWILAEPLAYQVYRLAGVPAPYTEHLRLSLDDRLMGVHLLIEQPNESFLARNGRDDAGNLYKLAWFGQGVIEQHQKRTNLRSGHDDLVQVLDGLTTKSGAEQWDWIEKNFQVQEFVSYYAVNTCIQNWDGYFNNHYLYHDLGRTGKWEVYPWDEDKTWGDYDGSSSDYDLYEMPLTYGMTGDQSPRDFDRWGSGLFGGVSWWRPPGHFSGPLLANPEFRKRFLTRVQELCATQFTPKALFPMIDAMEKQLEPEVRLRATVQNQDPQEQLQEFSDAMESFREQVQNRRKFILKALATEGKGAQ